MFVKLEFLRFLDFALIRPKKTFYFKVVKISIDRIAKGMSYLYSRYYLGSILTTDDPLYIVTYNIPNLSIVMPLPTILGSVN